MKQLEFGGKATGVVFGFLKSISALKDEFQTDRVAFCFEHKRLFRRDLFPDYKSKRRQSTKTPEEKAAYKAMAIQIEQLRTRYLPQIGFKNIFCFEGMESDDIMAAIAEGEAPNNVILVTADSDLYQCLTPWVSIYSPQKQMLYTDAWFRKEYEINPKQWAVVKAIAGCKSDEVPGVYGVGEVTALKFVRGELPKSSKAWQGIMSKTGKWTVRRNRQLVELPFPGRPILYKLQEDRIDREGWKEVCGALGMRSIANHPPIATRRLVR